MYAIHEHLCVLSVLACEVGQPCGACVGLTRLHARASSSARRVDSVEYGSLEGEMDECDVQAWEVHSPYDIKDGTPVLIAYGQTLLIPTG